MNPASANDVPALLPWQPLLNRRDLLRVGALGLSSALLPGLVPGASRESGSAKSVIVLWMAGGVTHIDTFDPKPEAGEEVRGTLKAIPTALTGVQFCETLPCLARQAKKLALVRTFASGNDDHFLSQAYALSGRKVPMSQIDTEPNVGALVARLLGPRAGLPGYLAVPGTTRPGPPPKNLFTAGWLGREYDPFCTGGKPKHEDFTARVREAAEEEFHLQALQLFPELESRRLAQRRSLRERLDQSARAADKAAGVETLRRQYRGAFDMLLSPDIRRAFDLRQEPDRVRESYGKTKIGQRCLLARRLVEAGARFVLVDYGYDPEYGNLWDQHNAAGQNFPHVCEMVKRPYHVAGMDRAFAALLEDLEVRGRLPQTLVVYLTEFGRTPRINKQGGRDHWGRTGSIFLAGGGVQAGQVIGATDRVGGDPKTPPISPAEVAATIYTALGIEPHAMVLDRQRRPVPILPEGKPIPGIL